MAGNNKGKGKGAEFLRSNLSYDGEGCLLWPFNPGPHGYGQFGHEGRMYHANRYMCELVHGPAPTRQHQAAHSCGNGHLGCVHPKHLSWKTPLENAQDKIAHGTCYSKRGRPRQKLTQEQVDQIRLVRSTAEQEAIAAQFGVSTSSVRKILYGKSWTTPKRFNDFTPEQVRHIRSLQGTGSAAAIAAQLGVGRMVVYNIWSGKFWKHVPESPSPSNGEQHGR